MEQPEPVIHTNLRLDASLADTDLEARRLMDLAADEEVSQNYIAWHDAHANMNKARNGFWEDPVKAYEADMYWDADAIPAAPQWGDPGVETQA